MGKARKRKKGLWELQKSWLSCIGIGGMLLFVICSNTFAFQIPTGVNDLELRWDNTFKYNLGYRTTGQDEAILKSVNYDDGDRNFGRGIITNRLDILSEFDLQYKQRYGFRVSGSFWYDQRYHDRLDNVSAATSNHLENGQPAIGLSDQTKRYMAGPSGELLDAFVFGGVDIGPVPVNIKVGRHTVYWGESLFLSGAIHGVSYAQMPIDVLKGFSVPGTEAKELFRPLFNVSGTAQLMTNLSISGQYFLQWEPYRLPEAGSYFGFNDAMLMGGESLILGPGLRLLRIDDVEPRGTKDFGLSARWSPAWLDGTISIYYRRFSDKLFQTYVNVPARSYFFVYPDSIDLYGVSLSKQILGISVGAELSYRTNMPLNSEAIVTTSRPAEGETLGARGDTWHGVINGLYVFKPPLCDSATVAAEIVWNRVERVKQGDNVYKGRDGYMALDRVTHDFVGAAVSFSPTWFQVFPGVDLSIPLSWAGGVSGNSGVSFGGNAHAGNWSAGLSADVFNKYKFDLKYVDAYGDYETNAAGGIAQYNSNYALVKDRGMIAFTFKVSY